LKQASNIRGPCYAASVAWLWRIKAVNGTGVAIYAYPPLTTVTCPAAVPNPNFPPAIVDNQTGQTAAFRDAESLRLRFYLKHNGQRMWMQMEYSTTDSTLANPTKSRLVSFEGPNASQLAPGLTQGEMRYADYVTGQSGVTTVYYRLRCWSTEGEHTNPVIVSTTLDFAGVGGKWATNWLASVGTAGANRKTARGMAGLIPRNLRDGTGTITTANTVNWIDDSGTLDYADSEYAYSILLTPTGVEVGFDASLNKTQVDQSGGTGPNLAYATRIARVGDKIRVDSSFDGLAGRFGSLTGPLAVGDTVAGVSTFGTAAQWTARVHKVISGGNSHFNLCLLTGTLPTTPYTLAINANSVLPATPSAAFENIQRVVNGALSGGVLSGVQLFYSGSFVYEGMDLGGDGGGFHSNPGSKVGYWSGFLGRYPVTGVRILPKLQSEGRFSMSSCGMGNNDGGFNGVFFRDVNITGLMTQNRETWIVAGQAGAGGCGVLGLENFSFKSYDPNGYSGYGVKQNFRSQSPITADLRNGIFSPAQEHNRYFDSDGEINPQECFDINLSTVGVSADCLKTAGGRSFSQTDARGDQSQNTQTGPGYPPGRSTRYIVNCSHTGGDQAGAITNVGYFGVLNIDGFTHNPNPSGLTRQAFVLQEDPGGAEKGMWRNARGFILSEVNITNYVSNVGNEQDAFCQARGVERLTIGVFTFNSPNNKALFQLFELGVCDNGYVRFTGAGTAPNALYNYSNWPPVGVVPLSKRIQYQGVGITTPAAFQELQDGKQYTVIN